MGQGLQAGILRLMRPMEEALFHSFIPVTSSPPYSCEKLLMPGAAGHSSLLYQWGSQRGLSQDESLGTHGQVGGIGIGDHKMTLGWLQESHGSKGRKRGVCRGYSLGCEG